MLTFLASIYFALVLTQMQLPPLEFPTSPDFEFPELKQSDVNRGKALIRWLIDNRTENNTKTFNAGFIRLIFHDCFGGCDGCINLNDPSNGGMVP